MYAHPHLFIDAETTVQRKDANTITVTAYWVFDVIYSQSLILDFDSDQSGDFEAVEDDILYDYAFINIAAFNYFTYLVSGSNFTSIDSVTSFDAGIKDDHMTYLFTFDVYAPEGSELFISYFDETNFTAFEMTNLKSTNIEFEWGHKQLDMFNPYGAYLFL